MTKYVGEIVRQLLIDAELGYSAEQHEYQSWFVFVSLEPDQPDNCITIYTTTNIIQGRLNANGVSQEQDAFLIRVRSSDFRSGEDKANAIAKYLNEEVYRTSVVLIDTLKGTEDYYKVHSCVPRSSVLSLGPDQTNSKRYLFTINYTLTLEGE